MQTVPVVTDTMEESAGCSGSISFRTQPRLGSGSVKEGLPEEVTPELQKDDMRLSRPTRRKTFQTEGSLEAGKSLVQSSYTEKAPGAGRALADSCSRL